MRNLAVHGSSQIHLKMGWQRNVEHSVVIVVVIMNCSSKCILIIL